MPGTKRKESSESGVAAGKKEEKKQEKEMKLSPAEEEAKEMEPSRVEGVLGVTEEELVKQSAEERKKYIRKDERGELQFVHAKTGELTPIGAFTTPTIGELMEKVQGMDTNETKTSCKFYAKYGVDIGELQTRLKTDDKCMVQIAGNFNCLNVSSRQTPPDSGYMVEFAHEQKTQGPAATMGPIASHLYRVHFPMPGGAGQTLEHQVNLLEHVAQYAGVPINGKLTLTGNEQPICTSPDSVEEQIDAVVSQIKVGLQTDCRVMYGRDDRGKDIRLEKPFPMLDQCHGAAVNWNSLSVDHSRRTGLPEWACSRSKQRDIIILSRTVLRAAYEGVYLAALTRGCKNLYVTLVGGGVFGNPNELIVKELAHAHKNWANHPASRLEGVYLCAYSTRDNVEDLLEKEGIKITRTTK